MTKQMDKWYKYFTEYYGCDDEEVISDDRDLVSHNAIVDFKRSVKKEIENEIAKIEQKKDNCKEVMSILAFNHQIQSLKKAIEMLDTALPLKDKNG